MTGPTSTAGSLGWPITSDPAVEVGPVIDGTAVDRVAHYAELAAKDGTIVAARHDVPGGGHYVGPVVAVLDDPSSRVAHDEIFGPLLVALPADDVDHAIALADDSSAALTAGVFSRSPANVERIVDGLAAGNVYVNRGTTGAVVGRQPFGGARQSGSGFKSGGPDYLLQFADATVTTENTMRQGFSPDLLSPAADSAGGRRARRTSRGG